MSIFKACDIRGHFGTELTLSHADQLGFALARYTNGADILVGGDGRVSTPQLKHSLVDALAHAGCHVIDIGTVSTPMLYFARQHLGVQAAVMVTASHNPSPDNGFKLALGEIPITPDEIIVISQLMQSPEPAAVSRTAGHVSHVDIHAAYIAFAQQYAPQLDGMRIVVDCANGMAALAAARVWTKTSARVSYLFDTVDGNFPNHSPDPSNAASLRALCSAVVDTQADLGVAYDGDADRVVFVDANGEVLSGDRAIVLFIQRALAHGAAPIVYDQKCSLIVAEAIRELGGEPVMERSGHTFIKTTFLRLNAPYAGEISGHHFFRELGSDDGLIASLFMADLIKHSGKSLADLASDIHTYPITPDIRIKMDKDTAHRVIADLVAALQTEAHVSTLDGLRAEFADGWGMARLSVTEPAITLRFEGKNEASLARIMQRFEQAAPDLRGALPHRS